jgi:hypothetical protein
MRSRELPGVMRAAGSALLMAVTMPTAVLATVERMIE